MNSISISGNLASAPEVRFTPRGSKVTIMSIGHNERWTDETGAKREKHFFLRIEAWGRLGENCAQYLVKGQEVFVTGKLEIDCAKNQDGDQYYTKVVATSVDFGRLPAPKSEKPEEAYGIQAPF